MMPDEQKGPNLERVENTDERLVSDIGKGDDDAAQVLFERYVGRLHKLAERQLAREISGRIDTEDVTQSVFRTLFRRIQAGQYAVPPGDSIWQLLMTIALNKVRAVGAHHRAAKRDIRRSSDVEPETLTALATSDDEATVSVLRMTIGELMHDLSESQQQIIQMRLESHDVMTIAATTKRSKRTVERVLHGFRQRLQQVLNEGTKGTIR